MSHGLLIVYTGHGKGKTTAAFGQALRALGHAWKVCMIQFLKGDSQCGEHLAAAQYLAENFEIHTLGDGFTWTSSDRAQTIRRAREAWDFAKTRLQATSFQMLILDELTYLVRYGIIAEQELLDALATRQPNLHVVVTGRDASPGLLAAADLATDMQALKHPFQHGLAAQPGIEF